MSAVLREFLEKNNISQSDAARGLHLTLPQFNRIARGHVPVGWSLVGRAWYYWSRVLHLPGVEDMISALGDSIHNREQKRSAFGFADAINPASPKHAPDSEAS